VAICALNNGKNNNKNQPPKKLKNIGSSSRNKRIDLKFKLLFSRYETS